MTDEIKLRLYYHPNQQRIFSSPAKVKVIAKGRRFGLTKGLANYVIERMLDGLTPCLWIDTVNSNIDRYVERYFAPALRGLPPEHWQWRQQRKELTILDRKCDLRSADKPELIEGFAYRLIILNEAGIILNDEYLWENSIRPMVLDFNPELIIGGTPKGKNLFFDLKAKAEDKQDERYKDWEFFHFTSYDNPFLDRAEIDALVADLPEHVRRQEIYGEFLEDMTGVFKNLDEVIGKSQAREWRADETCYIGADLGKAVDFTVITVLDGEGNQIYFNRLQGYDWPYHIKTVAETARKYPGIVYVDSTGAGDPIFDALKREGITVEGYHFTAESKRRLVECLMLSLEHKELKLLNEPIQTNELKFFSYETTASGLKYSAPSGKHDDCVFGLALANWGRKNRPLRRIIFLGDEPSFPAQVLEQFAPKEETDPEVLALNVEANVVRMTALLQCGHIIPKIATMLKLDLGLMQKWRVSQESYIAKVQRAKVAEIAEMAREIRAGKEISCSS
jgi:hypothetical protein